jgi:hypothetical protein
MVISSTLDFLGINVVKNMDFNVIGYITTKYGCNSIIFVHWTSEFIVFSLIPIH